MNRRWVATNRRKGQFNEFYLELWKVRCIQRTTLKLARYKLGSLRRRLQLQFSLRVSTQLLSPTTGPYDAWCAPQHEIIIRLPLRATAACQRPGIGSG